MGRFLKMPPEALVSLLSLAFFIETQVRGLHIRPHACYNSFGDLGTCMFVWECIKTEGKHLGTCADGFLFGSCCAHNDTNNNLVPESETVFTTTTKKPTTFFASTTATGLSTFYPSGSELSSFYKPTTAKPVTEWNSRPQYSKPTIQTAVNSWSLHTKTTAQPTVHSVPSGSKTTQKTYLRPTSLKPTAPSTVSSMPYNVKPTNQISYSRPPFFKPTVQSSVYSRPSYSRPTFQTTSHSRPSYPKPTFSSIVYSKPQTTGLPTHANFTSTTPLPLIDPSHNEQTTRSTTRRPSTKPTAAIHGFSSSIHTSDYWFRPTGYTSLYSSTKYPNIPSKSPINRPQSSPRPTKYPYPRPSWKPQPITSGFSSLPSTKPAESFTESSTRPSVFTIKTTTQTKRPTLITKTTTSKPVSIVTDSPVITVRPTVFIWPPITSNYSTQPPISSSTHRTTIFGKPPVSVTSLVTSPKTTTRPSPSTSSWPAIISVFNVSTHINWIPTESSSSTMPSTPYNGQHSPNSSGTLSDVLSPFVHFKPPSTIRPTWKPLTVFQDISSKPSMPLSGLSTSTLTSVTDMPVRKTTPLPISPCGIPDPHPQKKVVGGRNSAFGSWPWQASVRRISFFGFSSTHRCGGALISRQWVATAGHCVDDLLLSQIKIRVGEYDFASVQEPHGFVERGAKQKLVHPRYNFFTYENDLALVQLEEAIDPHKHPHISPICLPPSEENLVGRNATVTGWGRLTEGGVLPSILQEVQVPIISNEKCKNMFLAAGRHEYIPDIFMCAGFEEGGRDSCQGDSGGPLQIQSDEGYWFLAGIISWGIGCAEPNMPGVCTRISKFKDWIVQQIT